MDRIVEIPTKSQDKNSKYDKYKEFKIFMHKLSSILVYVFLIVSNVQEIVWFSVFLIKFTHFAIL